MIKNQHRALKQAIFDVESTIADLVDELDQELSQFLAVSRVLRDALLFSLQTMNSTC